MCKRYLHHRHADLMLASVVDVGQTSCVGCDNVVSYRHDCGPSMDFSSNLQSQSFHLDEKEKNMIF